MPVKHLPSLWASHTIIIAIWMHLPMLIAASAGQHNKVEMSNCVGGNLKTFVLSSRIVIIQIWSISCKYRWLVSIEHQIETVGETALTASSGISEPQNNSVPEETVLTLIHFLTNGLAPARSALENTLYLKESVQYITKVSVSGKTENRATLKSN